MTLFLIAVGTSPCQPLDNHCEIVDCLFLFFTCFATYWQEVMTGPIKLHCGHIYCDSCISEWFERER